MRANDLLVAIERAQLVGRGGASFPAHLKWRRIKELDAPKKYVVCNASEGEMGVRKDFYLLEKFPEKVFKGMVLAMDFLSTKEGYLNINKNYYQTLKSKIDPVLQVCRQSGYLINVFEEDPSYIGGETGALLNAIEGKKTQPRPDEPSPSVKGIFGCPVLLHNVETLYDVARVAEGSYQPTRLATILGVAHEGVFEVANTDKVAAILRATDNYPAQPFFALVGGGASGEVITPAQAEEATIWGCGSIEVYPLTTTPKAFLSKIFNFYAKESCGKCTPCRDGSWQLKEIVANLADEADKNSVPWAQIAPILTVMEQTSYCGLGRAIALPIRSYARNICGVEV